MMIAGFENRVIRAIALMNRQIIMLCYRFTVLCFVVSGTDVNRTKQESR